MRLPVTIAALALLHAAPGRALPPPPVPIHACVNLGNHLESPTEGAWGRRLTDRDFAVIARGGFDAVRMPARWSAHAAAAAPYTIDPAFLARVTHLVDRALAKHLTVILDDHNYDALFADPDGHRARLAGIWQQIATAFASRSDRLWFEIENEPHDRLTNANLVATLGGALDAIRATNPARTVVIGGENYSGIDSLATLALPDDPHLVPTFHYYSPFDFTHQGAGWVKPVQPLGRHYGTPADADLLARDAAKLRAYIERTRRVPLMGEVGAYETAPVAERAAYLGAVRTAFAPLGTGVCAWAYTSTFPLYDSAARTWLPGMRAAMGLAR